MLASRAHMALASVCERVAHMSWEMIDLFSNICDSAPFSSFSEIVGEWWEVFVRAPLYWFSDRGGVDLFDSIFNHLNPLDRFR